MSFIYHITLLKCHIVFIFLVICWFVYLIKLLPSDSTVGFACWSQKWWSHWEEEDKQRTTGLNGCQYTVCFIRLDIMTFRMTYESHIIWCWFFRLIFLICLVSYGWLVCLIRLFYWIIVYRLYQFIWWSLRITHDDSNAQYVFQIKQNNVLM